MSAAHGLPAREHTAADLERISADGRRCELVTGELREMSPAGARHGNLTLRLTTYLQGHAEGP